MSFLESMLIGAVGGLIFVVWLTVGKATWLVKWVEQFTTGAIVHTEHFICSTDDISNCDYYDVYVVASKYDTRFTEPHVNLWKDWVGISFSGANTIASSKRVK